MLFCNSIQRRKNKNTSRLRRYHTSISQNYQWQITQWFPVTYVPWLKSKLGLRKSVGTSRTTISPWNSTQLSDLSGLIWLYWITEFRKSTESHNRYVQGTFFYCFYYLRVKSDAFVGNCVGHRQHASNYLTRAIYMLSKTEPTCWLHYKFF